MCGCAYCVETLCFISVFTPLKSSVVAGRVNCADWCDHPTNAGGTAATDLPMECCYRRHGRRTPTDREKNELLLNSEGRCVYQVHQKCETKGGRLVRGEATARANKLVVEHITPWRRGGYDGMKNWRASCRFCNSEKGAANHLEYCATEKGNRCALMEFRDPYQAKK
jgi:HNH endonuclease